MDADSFQRLYTGIFGPKPGWRAAPLAGESALPSASRAPVPRRAPDPRAAPPEIELVHRLTHQHVERIAVKRARVHADAVAFFLARRGYIQATCADPNPPRGLGPIPWTERRFALTSVLEQQQPYCGAPWRDALTSRIVRSLGREGVQQIALVPISVYGRPVAFLYADAGRRPFAARGIAELSSICSDIAVIFERMIVERKRDRTS
ncbi:MAG TPA: hypothetical protein VII72_08725 [Myxococcota bacterium]